MPRTQPRPLRFSHRLRSAFERFTSGDNELNACRAFYRHKIDYTCDGKARWSGERPQMIGFEKDWSGREDLNLRPPGPEPGQAPYCDLLNLVDSK